MSEFQLLVTFYQLWQAADFFMLLLQSLILNHLTDIIPMSSMQWGQHILNLWKWDHCYQFSTWQNFWVEASGGGDGGCIRPKQQTQSVGTQKSTKKRTLSVLFKSCLQSVALIVYLKAHMLTCFAILIFSPLCVCCVECSRTQPHILEFFNLLDCGRY